MALSLFRIVDAKEITLEVNNLFRDDGYIGINSGGGYTSYDINDFTSIFL
ncbi:hypothetical protein [Chryseobacterium soli]|nr:hypothetical protein [Chryseobacterium soli]